MRSDRLLCSNLRFCLCLSIMNDGDTTAILPGDVLEAATYEEDTTTDDLESTSYASRCSRHRRPPFACPFSVSVEPVIFLSMFSLALQAPLATQYLWDRISEDLGYNGTKAGECANASAKHDPLQKVEMLTAHWNLAINIAGFAVGLLTSTLLGSWSDVAGRRPVLILPSVGLAVQASVYLLVMYLKLPVVYFLLGRLLSGLLGDFYAILAGCFAYVADVGDGASLTFRVAVLEACLGVAGMLASVVGGQWRKAQGYINPFWLVLATNVASALYAYLFVPESITPDPGARLLSTRHHRAIWGLYASGGRSHRRAGLWLYALSFFVVLTVHSGTRELLVLYQLSPPLCWGPELIGYGSAALHLAYLSSLLGLRLLQRCLKDPWVAVAGLCSNAAGLVVFSVADTTALMFAGYGLCLLFMTGTPVIRSKMSKLVEQSEQGALFASVACVEGLCGLVASGLFNSLYPATLYFMKGFTFLFAAVLLGIPAGIIGTLECRDQRRENREMAASLQ